MFDRDIEEYFKEWQIKAEPHPLLIRGARQIGKSYTVRKFAQENFDNLVEINFERQPELKSFFETSLDPQKICDKIYSATEQKITKGKTLVFLDEIQQCPRAILSLRYFYEEMPGLHVIGAGSLLDFALQSGEISIPVGRIHYIYMKPVSFYEYLKATKQDGLLKWIQSLSVEQEYDAMLDAKANEELKKYFYLGGMPEVIDESIKGSDIDDLLTIQQSILASYRDDFGKYASRVKHKYLESVLQSIPRQLCQKFKYSKVDPDTQSRELKEALGLLIDAGVAYKVRRASGAGIPLGAGASDKHFKTILLDIGLVQNLLGIDKEIVLAEDIQSIAAGALAEQFVGQELLANKEFYKESEIHYWAREDVSNAAEVDYLIAIGSSVIPIEVKSSHRGKLKSLRSFMQNFDCDLGLRVSTNRLDLKDGILSVPLYATAEIPRLLRSIKT